MTIKSMLCTTLEKLQMFIFLAGYQWYCNDPVEKYLVMITTYNKVSTYLGYSKFCS